MSLDEILNLLSGGGALGFAILIIWAFITEKIVPKGRLDDQKALTKEAIDGWKSQTQATNRMADAWDARNEAEDRRSR